MKERTEAIKELLLTIVLFATGCGVIYIGLLIIFYTADCILQLFPNFDKNILEGVAFIIDFCIFWVSVFLCEVLESIVKININNKIINKFNNSKNGKIEILKSFFSIIIVLAPIMYGVIYITFLTINYTAYCIMQLFPNFYKGGASGTAVIIDFIIAFSILFLYAKLERKVKKSNSQTNKVQIAGTNNYGNNYRNTTGNMVGKNVKITDGSKVYTAKMNASEVSFYEKIYKGSRYEGVREIGHKDTTPDFIPVSFTDDRGNDTPFIGFSFHIDKLGNVSIGRVFYHNNDKPHVNNSAKFKQGAEEKIGYINFTKVEEVPSLGSQKFQWSFLCNIDNATYTLYNTESGETVKLEFY